MLFFPFTDNFLLKKNVKKIEMNGHKGPDEWKIDKSTRLEVSITISFLFFFKFLKTL